MDATEDNRRRVLFMSEAVTLAHVARPHVLANSLSPERYHVLLARDPRYDHLFPDTIYQRVPLQSISSATFMRSLARGKAVYDRDTLQRYVIEDLAIIDSFAPHAIVGDFRLSLSVSARLRGIPYLGISNAYWSPYAKLDFRCPELPLTRWLGYRVSDWIFRVARPIGFAVHARPLNQLRQLHGLNSLGYDVRRSYTDADVVLYADIEALVPLSRQPSDQHFMGPIVWSPSIPWPPAWPQIDRSRPTIYVTLGSSGDPRHLPTIITGLAKLDLNVIVSTAGAELSKPLPENVYAAKFVPGSQAAEMASLVICNGGSPATYQALLAGTPVIGVPTNLDQLLNLSGLEKAGVAAMVRPDQSLATRLPALVMALLKDTRVADSVSRIQNELISYDACSEFERLLCALDLPQIGAPK